MNDPVERVHSEDRSVSGRYLMIVVPYNVPSSISTSSATGFDAVAAVESMESVTAAIGSILEDAPVTRRPTSVPRCCVVSTASRHVLESTPARNSLRAARLVKSPTRTNLEDLPGGMTALRTGERRSVQASVGTFEQVRRAIGAASFNGSCAVSCVRPRHPSRTRSLSAAKGPNPVVP